ncbi:MAG: MFS transporter [Alphaproteobacteria bacterium]
MFFIGSAIFAAFSVLGGLAPNIWMLLACRFLMGIGGAMMWPAILGMTFALVPRSKAGLAGGLIMASAGFGNAFGPLLGGVLTDTIGWEWVFFLNLPIAVAGMLITYLVVPRGEDRRTHGGIDYLGMGVLTIGLFAMLLALDLGTRLGWASPVIIGLFAMSGVALAKFFFDERRAGGIRPGARRCHAQSRIRGCLLHRLDDVGNLLRRAPLPSAVHGQSPEF